MTNVVLIDEMGGKEEVMADPYHVKGSDGIVRGLNEHYDSQKDVEQDPYGAWLAIQNLWTEREELEAKLAKAIPALRVIRDDDELWMSDMVETAKAALAELGDD